MTAGVRFGMHASTIVSVLARKRSKAWVAAAIGSFVVDALVVKRHRQGNLRPHVLQPLIDAADATMWTFAHPSAEVSNITATVMPGVVSSSISLGFDIAADTDAVPNLPAQRGASRQIAIAQAIATAVVPPLVVTIVQRRRGSRFPTIGWIWGPIGLGYGLALGRGRMHAQRRTREEWMRRADRAEEVAWRAARLAAATGTTPGHDFKKTLLQIGALGSEEAAGAARLQADLPRRLVEASTEGSTLFDVAFGVRIEPPQSACLWLSPGQGAEVERFLGEALDRATDGADPVLRARLVTGEGISLDVLGSSTLVRHEMPPVHARLHPTAAGFLLSLAQLLVPQADGTPSLPIWSRMAAIGVDAVGIARFWNRPPTSAEIPWVVALSLLHSATVLVACALSPVPTRTKEGVALFASAPALSGSAIILGTHWRQLSPVQRAALPTVVAAWFAVVGASKAYRPAEVLSHLLLHLPNFVALMGLEGHVEDEAALLQQQLASRFDQRLGKLQERAFHEQVAYHREQVALAERELAAHAHEATPEQVRAIEHDIEALRRWLDADASDLGAQRAGS